MPTNSRYAMIMAGGAGTRLWPMSRRHRPKQLLPFIHGRSLLEETAARLEGLIEDERRYVCTGESYRGAVRAALPDFADAQILGEPVGRNTVNAVGFMAAILASQDPDAVFAVLTADHLIEPREEFHRSLDVGFGLVEADRTHLVTFAIRPTFAATGYGWVERGDPVPGTTDAFFSRGFAEKPDEETAERYLASGTWGWNSGMFVFHAAQFMETLSWFEPASHEGLGRIADAWPTDRRTEILEAVYPDLRADSVDYAVMEPAAGDERLSICCVPMNVSWLDVGSWPSYGDTLPADDAGCRANTRTIHVDSSNVLAVSDDPDHVIATVGCDDLIVVHTGDVTMVCPAASASVCGSWWTGRTRPCGDHAEASQRLRFLSIDLGDKRTGVAAGDDGSGVVSPLTVLHVPRGETLLDAVLRVVAEHEPDAIVVGLPLNMDGTEGDRARISREFGDELARRAARPVHYQDERLTSDEADHRLARSGRTHRQKKAVRDALAAAAILTDYLESRRS